MPRFLTPNVSVTNLREFNPCHEPAGSPTGGRFAPKGQGNCEGGPSTETEETRASRVATVAATIRQNAQTDEEREYATALAEAVVRGEEALRDGDSKSKHTRNGVYTPERQAVHEQILTRFFSEQQGKPRGLETPVAVLMGGLTAAGKSTAVGNMKLTDKVVINSDDFKTLLPEYAGWNAAYLHEESSDLADRALAVARSLRMNVVLDSTMKSLGGVDYNDAKRDGGVAAKIEGFKAEGYRVEVRFVDVDINDSVRRSIQRFVRQQQKSGQGRYVPIEYIRSNATKGPWASKPRETFERVKGHVDSFILVDNRGRSPRILETRGRLTN